MSREARRWLSVFVSCCWRRVTSPWPPILSCCWSSRLARSIWRKLFALRWRELCVLKAQNGVPDWQQIEALLKEWQPDALVVGLPLNMDGSPSEMSERAEKFARRLHGRYQLPVHTHDERLTTYEAKGQRLAQGQRGGYRERPVDAIAAALLLQGWLEQHGA